MAEPILIWGAGAIGGTLGAYWARAGLDVLLVDIVEEHVARCAGEGLRISGPVDSFSVRVPAVTPDVLRGRFERIILAVKAQHTVEATRMLKPHLAENGFVLSAQNGLNEIEIADAIGAENTMGAFVNFGADWHGPGEILYGNRGAVVVGEIDGSIRARTRAMHEALRIFEPDAVLTDDIWAYLWGKLGYGAMLFGTALTMDSMSDNFADPKRERAWVALAREVMAVAVARGVKPRGFNGYEPAAFMPGAGLDAARACIATLAEFNRHTAKTHSGIWRDLAVRKRRTEVDAQIGIITRLGVESGVRTPAITRLVELIHDIEDGRREQSMDTLGELLRVC
ncbi:MAG: ketopantoate reductase family protein [Alphaproteobacteria bacterium]|nr:ketopantoate reductase family protein [Alphaproteobacteria bacterium]